MLREIKVKKDRKEKLEIKVRKVRLDLLVVLVGREIKVTREIKVKKDKLVLIILPKVRKVRKENKELR